MHFRCQIDHGNEKLWSIPFGQSPYLTILKRKLKSLVSRDLDFEKFLHFLTPRKCYLDVWCNPPYTKDSDLIERILQHFLAEWRADPENTSAMFLLPDYYAPWRRLIHPKYGLHHPVKVFDTKDEKGRPKHLFESPDGGRPPPALASPSGMGPCS